MNRLLLQQIEILFEQGKVEELYELFAQSVELGKEGAAIRQEINARVHLLAEYYKMEKEYDSFRSFLKDYDFYYSPLRDIATVHGKTFYYLSTNAMPYTFAEFVRLFHRSGFEKFVVFPFKIYPYQEILPVSWDEETRTTLDFSNYADQNLDWEDFSSVGLGYPSITYHFLRKGEEFIIEKYSAPIMWNEEIEGSTYQPAQLITRVETDFKNYRSGRFRYKLYNEIDGEYFTKEASDLNPEGTSLGVYDQLNKPADAVQVAFDLLYFNKGTRVAITPNWNNVNYWVAYYLNEETIRVRELWLSNRERPDDEGGMHKCFIVVTRIPISIQLY